VRRGRPVVGGVAQERGIDSVREWGAAVGRVWHASVVWCRKSIRVMVMSGVSPTEAGLFLASTSQETAD
jgi:hypothetical protein